MKRVFSIAILIIVLIALAGCTIKKGEDSSKKAKDNKDKKLGASHTVNKKEEKKILKDVKENIALLAQMREDTTTLAKGFTSQALENLVKTHDEDMADGKIKVRVFEKSDYSVNFASKKIIAVTWSYVDKSYYIDKDTQKVVQKPEKKKHTFALAVVEDNKHWKIGQIMLPAKEPKKPKE